MADASFGAQEDRAYRASSADQPAGNMVVDSGCTKHLFKHKEVFKSYKRMDGKVWTAGAGDFIRAIGCGDVPVKVLTRLALSRC